MPLIYTPEIKKQRLIVIMMLKMQSWDEHIFLFSFPGDKKYPEYQNTFLNFSFFFSCVLLHVKCFPLLHRNFVMIQVIIVPRFFHIHV